MKLSEKMTLIQSAIKAPKSQHNKFGNYNYRNCEDICEGLKPLLKENALILTLTDSIESIGDYIFLKATAQVTDGNEAITTSAYARHPATKKGMDDSQITGATSSYARKYALAGMFLLDDTKDADSQAPVKKETTIEYYSVEDFNKNFPAWEKLIATGAHTAQDIIAKASQKCPLTPHQQKRLTGVQVTTTDGS